MISQVYPAYRHSGKFAVRGPILAVLSALILWFPLGFAYSYLIKWIPLIYINFLATMGYGFAVGIVTGWILKAGKVRNTAVAMITTFAAGLISLYYAWNAHIHAMFQGAPVLSTPSQLKIGMELLYNTGSWGIGHSGNNLTGIPLAIVWIGEALIILGLALLACWGIIADTPYCEETRCWLDQELKISTLQAFTDPAHVAAFKSNDLGPLIEAKPRQPASAAFARVTLKHSPRCQNFFTVRVENISEKTNKKGETTQTTVKLTPRDLVVPHSMFELIKKFEAFKPADAPEQPPATPAVS
jgi:hypothetical protein